MLIFINMEQHSRCYDEEGKILPKVLHQKYLPSIYNMLPNVTSDRKTNPPGIPTILRNISTTYCNMLNGDWLLSKSDESRIIEILDRFGSIYVAYDHFERMYIFCN